MQTGNEKEKTVVTPQQKQVIASSSSSVNNQNLITAPQARVDLDKLLDIWATTWAKEKTGKGYLWYITDEREIKNNDGSLKKLKHLDPGSNIPQEFLSFSVVGEPQVVQSIDLPDDNIQKNKFAVRNDDTVTRTVPITGKFTYEKTQSKTFSSTVTTTKGITAGINATMPGIPVGISLQAVLSRASANANLTQCTERTATETESDYSSDITLPGKSLGTVEASCKQIKKQITTTYPVKIEGNVYICLRK